MLCPLGILDIRCKTALIILPFKIDICLGNYREEGEKVFLHQTDFVAVRI